MEGCEFNTVLVWNHSRLSREVAELVELSETLSEHSIDLVLATESLGLGTFKYELDWFTDVLDDEAAS